MKKIFSIMCILSILSISACSTMTANNQSTKQQGSYLGTNVGVGFVAF